MFDTKTLKIIVILSITLLLWLAPVPLGLTNQAWHLFALFIGIVVAIMMNVLPMGATTIIGLVVAVVTKTLSFEQAFYGFSHKIVWLVLGAFFISSGLIKSGLGKRIAYKLIAILGKSILGLGYGLAFGELVLATVIPSATARTGGIILPIAKSLVESIGEPTAAKDKSAVNSFLLLLVFQVSIISSAMFLTGMAGNPLIQQLIFTSININVTWASWALAAILPGLLSIILIPMFLKKYFNPKLNHDSLSSIVNAQYSALGPMQFEEKVMSIIFCTLILLWGFGDVLGVDSTISVFIGISLMLIFRVINWNDLLSMHSAWDTFIWFGALLALATGLKDLEFSLWFGNYMVYNLSNYNVYVAFCGLILVYFYSHYLFASSTAHISSMLVPFLYAASQLNVFSPELIAMLFIFSSNLFASLTHYGNGPAPIIYGQGYIGIKTWWKIGFMVSVLNICIWFGIGSIWWQIIGIL